MINRVRGRVAEVVGHSLALPTGGVAFVTLDTALRRSRWPRARDASAPQDARQRCKAASRFGHRGPCLLRYQKEGLSMGWARAAFQTRLGSRRDAGCLL